MWLLYVWLLFQQHTVGLGADNVFGIDDFFVAITALITGLTSLVVAATGFVKIMLTLRTVVKGQAAALQQANQAMEQAKATHDLVNSQSKIVQGIATATARNEGYEEGIAESSKRAINEAIASNPDIISNYEAEEGYQS